MSETGAQTAPQHKHVTITDEQGSVDQEWVEVWRDTGVQVIWMTSLPKGFKVVFDGPEGSPFDTDTFVVPASGKIHSGEPRRGGKYKYTVHGPCGATDPGVIIRP